MKPMKKTVGVRRKKDLSGLKRKRFGTIHRMKSVESVEDNGVWDSRELRLPGSQKVVGKIRFISSGPLSREKQEMLELILPYVAWALQNGVNLICLDDEIKQVEKNYYVHEQHLIENKRKNTVKKACLSIVTGMLPYIDRIVNETRKLNTELLTRTEEVKRNRITYIDELITQINEYNEILALWIKVRQGALSLHIESFPLQPLFAVVEKPESLRDEASDVAHYSDRCCGKGRQGTDIVYDQYAGGKRP